MQNIHISEPVLWFEGMPLLPQHFQQEFTHLQSLFQIQLQVLGGFNYGVLNLEIDTLSLIKNAFKINKIFAIMPDGLVIHINSNSNVTLEVVLPNPSEYEKNSLSIYLTVPKLIAENYLVGKYPRYRKEMFNDILDYHTGQDGVEIAKMLPNVRLASSDDLNSNFVSLKVASLKIEKNLWTLNEYSPATVQITKMNPIYAICSEISYSIRKKIHHLSELIQSKSIESQANFISENLLYAQGLGLALPSLEGLLLSEKAHPFQLYLALCQILGGLGLLTNKFAPPSPNPYQHEELLATFHLLKKEIESTINSVINDKVTQIFFIKEENNYSVEVLKDYLIDGLLLIGFKKKSACSETDFIHWIKNAIICPSNQVDITLQNRTLGYHRDKIERTEDILPAKNIYLYRTSVTFSNIESEKMTILNNEDLINSPEEIFIFVKKQQRK